METWEDGTELNVLKLSLYILSILIVLNPAVIISNLLSNEFDGTTLTALTSSEYSILL